MRLDVFHHEIMGTATLPCIVSHDDVGMDDLAGSAHFALKALHGFGILHDPFGQHLQSDELIEPPMEGLEDLPHAAGADPIDQHIVAQHQRRIVTGEQLVALKRIQLAVV